MAAFSAGAATSEDRRAGKSSKQVPGCDGGARRPRGRTVMAHAALRDDDLGSPPGRGGTDDGQVGSDGHARQRLTPETQRLHRQQVIGGANLGRAVPLDGQPQVAAGDPAPVVGDRDARAPAALHLDGDASRTGIERVVQQLAHDGQRTLDHFTGGNTRSDGRWQRLYPCRRNVHHATMSSQEPAVTLLPLPTAGRALATPRAR